MRRHAIPFIQGICVVMFLTALLFAAWLVGDVTAFNRQCTTDGGIVVRTPTDFQCIKVQVIRKS